jgi:two-component system, chemotaxis family, response regulator WspF
MRIAIVNHLSAATATIRQIIQTVPDYQVAWIAKDGAEAVTACMQDVPDLILMGLSLPGIDGVEATRRIMQRSACPILIVAPSTAERIDQVYKAISYGAIDAVDLPERHQPSQQLLSKISNINKLTKSPTTARRNLPTPTSAGFSRSTFSSAAPPLIAIGSSTGGPKALVKVLSQLPKDCGAAIAIVQHIDAQFSTGLVAWLNQQINLPVKVAKIGNSLEPGFVTIASTNDHLHVKSDLTLGYTKDPIEYPYRPSVDVFFKSLSEHWPRRGTAVLLTGMGRDGAVGLAELRSRGWHTIAQDQASCVVYGMPKAAVELNAAVEVLPPDRIAATLATLTKNKR